MTHAISERDAPATCKMGNSPISIGRFTYGYENVAVLQEEEGAALHIGAFCSIAANVTVYLGGNHRTDWISTFPFGHVLPEELGSQVMPGHPCTKGDVTIGNDVWLCSGSTIMSGVTIGDGAVIAANATVTRDVAPYQVVGGNPGRHIRYRFDNEIIRDLMALQWWSLPTATIREIAPMLSQQPTRALIAEIGALVGRVSSETA